MRGFHQLKIKADFSKNRLKYIISVVISQSSKRYNYSALGFTTATNQLNQTIGTVGERRRVFTYQHYRQIANDFCTKISLTEIAICLKLKELNPETTAN